MNKDERDADRRSSDVVHERYNNNYYHRPAVADPVSISPEGRAKILLPWL